ncbi:hypothetical protein FKW77_010831 [Venturia effusa]|uniref:Uncharacterized protein n=1 Tax=Venturia effusa TaxID=50376 RepID=A0A517KYL5_9PEZI|nr:hypothetical protein FKW77_010831 [Venturia effusa]
MDGTERPISQRGKPRHEEAVAFGTLVRTAKQVAESKKLRAEEAMKMAEAAKRMAEEAEKDAQEANKDVEVAKQLAEAVDKIIDDVNHKKTGMWESCMDVVKRFVKDLQKVSGVGKDANPVPPLLTSNLTSLSTPTISNSDQEKLAAVKSVDSPAELPKSPKLETHPLVDSVSVTLDITELIPLATLPVCNIVGEAFFALPPKEQDRIGFVVDGQPRNTAGSVVFLLPNQDYEGYAFSTNVKGCNSELAEIRALVVGLRVALRKANASLLIKVFVHKIVAYLDPLHWLKVLKDMRRSDSSLLSIKQLWAVAGQIEYAGIELEIDWVPKEAKIMPHVIADRLVAEQQMMGKISAKNSLSETEFRKLEKLPMMPARHVVYTPSGEKRSETVLEGKEFPKVTWGFKLG